MYRFSKKKPQSVFKASSATVLQELRSFLDEAEPELVRWLVNLWNSQGNAVTYKEIREAILRGDFAPATLAAWQQDYVRFVREHLDPAWAAAMEAATKKIISAGGWRFDPMTDGIRQWTATRAADFVTSCTQDQIDGLRAVIRRAALLEDRNVDDLARVIRPMVGLYQGQAVANLNYYNSLIDAGMSRKKALDKAIRYGARQHRYRAFMIARTELAFAYNQGAYQGTKQAMDKGYLPMMEKVWATARDERVCPVCGGMNGMRVGIDDDFPFPTRLTDPIVKKMPPAHPNCRCAVKFEEVEK